MWYRCVRPFLFLLPPETSHRWMLYLLRWLYPVWRVKNIQKKIINKPQTLLNLTFPNPIGLAAGLDKNAEALDALFGLGFGFIEVGAVTPEPQFGNPRPRLFRLPKASALINRLGFNNKGVDYLVERLKKRKITGIVGVNIGKNADTPLKDAIKDYKICLQKVFPYADFVTINISSPNTESLRALQGEAYLKTLLKGLKEEQQRLVHCFDRWVPLFIKISPDLSETEIDFIAHAVMEAGMEGMIAVNTTKDRDAVKEYPYAEEAGGLSGKPLLEKTIKVIQQLRSITKGNVLLIAVGGISSVKDVHCLLESGANLLQLYTALVYQGPGFVHHLLKQR